LGAGFAREHGCRYIEVIAAATQVGSNTVITFDATTSITLENITRTSLVADDFRFI
jgi:serralysin